MEQKTRNQMMMCKALNPRELIDRLYVSIKGGRGLVNIEDSVDASIRWLEDYIKRAKED